MCTNENRTSEQDKVGEPSYISEVKARPTTPKFVWEDKGERDD